MINERNGRASSTVHRRCDSSYGRVSDISGPGRSSRCEALRVVTDRPFPAVLPPGRFPLPTNSRAPTVPNHSRGARPVGTRIPCAVRHIVKLCDEHAAAQAKAGCVRIRARSAVATRKTRHDAPPVWSQTRAWGARLGGHTALRVRSDVAVSPQWRFRAAYSSSPDPLPATRRCLGLPSSRPWPVLQVLVQQIW